MFEHKKVTLLAFAVVATLALPGCSTAGDVASQGAKSVLELLREDPNKSLRTAVEKTDDVTSVAVAVSGTESNEKQDLKIKAQFGAAPVAEISMVDEGKPVTVLMSGAVMIMPIPSEDAATEGPFAGKKWIKLDLSTLSAEDLKGQDLDKADFSALFEGLKPKTQLTQLLDAAALKVAGEDTIDGAKAVHYTSTIPVAKHLAGLDAKERPEAEKNYTAAGVKDVKVDVWVDENYQLRKVVFKAGTVDDWTAAYSEYNSAVVSPLPPAGEVVEFAEMLKLIKEAQG